MSESLSFLREFLRRPTCVGAVAPSSRWLARRMVESGRLSSADTVVELGPGTGSFTRAILDTVAPSTTFFALEINKEFATSLRQRFPDLTVHNDSAEKDAFARNTGFEPASAARLAERPCFQLMNQSICDSARAATHSTSPQPKSSGREQGV